MAEDFGTIDEIRGVWSKVGHTHLKLNNDVEFKKNELREAVAHTGTAAERAAYPNPKEGQYWYDSDTGKYYIYSSATGNSAWPVGSVFIAVVSTNPNTLLGFGTWSSIGAGRTLIGLDSGDTDFDVVEETGGAKTQTLIESEIPGHNHIQDAHGHIQDAHGHTQDAHGHTQDAHNHTQDAHNHTQDAHNHTQNSHTHGPNTGSQFLTTIGSGGAYVRGSGTNATSSSLTNSATPTNVASTATNIASTATNIASTATNQTTVATNQTATATNQTTVATNQATGGDGAHSSVQPYFVVYFWKRTA